MDRVQRGGSYAAMGRTPIRAAEREGRKINTDGFRIVTEEIPDAGQSSKSRDRTQSQYKDIHKSG